MKFLPLPRILEVPTLMVPDVNRSEFSVCPLSPDVATISSVYEDGAAWCGGDSRIHTSHVFFEYKSRRWPSLSSSSSSSYMISCSRGPRIFFRLHIMIYYNTNKRTPRKLRLTPTAENNALVESYGRVRWRTRYKTTVANNEGSDL